MIPALGSVRGPRGVVLIITLWVLVILAVLALTFAETMHVEGRVALNEMDRTRALYAAKAGLQRAIIAVKSDQSGYAAESSSWASLNSEDDQFPFDDERYEVTVTDECAKIDLNAADETLLRRLPELTPEMVDSIVDWRDADDSPRPDGAESDYYGRLRPPRVPANRPFLTPEELLLVRGVTKEAYYGPRAAQSLSLTDTPSTAAADQPTPLRELFTLYSGDNDRDAQGRDRLNLNSADSDALTERTEGILTEADVTAILDYRKAAGSFTSIGDLLQVEGLTREKVQQLADLLTTVSQASSAQSPSAPQSGPTTPMPPVGPEGPTPPAPGEEGRQVSPTPGGPTPPEPTPGAPSAPTPAASTTDTPRLPAAGDYRAGVYNINTASLKVLETLEGMTAAAAEAIVRERQDQPFASRGELLRVPEVTDSIFAQIVEHTTVRSSALLVTSIGSVSDGRVRVRLRAVVDLKGTEPQIVCWAEG